jgi:hypothetical protein
VSVLNEVAQGRIFCEYVGIFLSIITLQKFDIDSSHPQDGQWRYYRRRFLEDVSAPRLKENELPPGETTATG